MRTSWLSVLICASLVADQAAFAQSPETLKAFEKEPHLGTMAEALVGLEVVNTAPGGGKTVRHGNGVMLRCDGFVLLPSNLFNKPDNSQQTATVTLFPGTDNARSVPVSHPAFRGKVRANGFVYAFPYAVFKLDNVHVPALRTLLPDSLKPQQSLTLVWSAWNESSHAFLPVQTREAALGELPKSEAFSVQGIRLLSAAQEGLPPGAMVAGPEGMAVGMVTEFKEGRSAQFVSFQNLEKATNCVNAVPLPDGAYLRRLRARQKEAEAEARRQRGEPTNTPQTEETVPEAEPAVPAGAEGEKPEASLQRVAANSAEMALVAGGKVTLPPILHEFQTDMFGAQTACVAPFLMDKFEVTNGQYWEFWKSLPRKQREDASFRAKVYPVGWGPEEEPFPEGLKKVPVLGVRLAGAKAYAKWAGKRLPTPYEWMLAAFGPSGGTVAPAWIKTYLTERKKAWEQIVEAHTGYVREHPELAPRIILQQEIINGKIADHAIFDPDYPSIEEVWSLPWFFAHPRYIEAARWSKETVEQILEPLFQKWVDPTYVLPVGSRPHDVSPYGIHDMVGNALELVLPGPGTPWDRYPDPLWSQDEVDRYIDIQWLDSNWREHKKSRPYTDRSRPVNAWLAGPFRFMENELGVTIIQYGVLAGWSNNLQGQHVFIEGGDPNLYGASYTWQMLSRRMSSRPLADVQHPPPADLMDYVLLLNALYETSEMLRPVDTCRITLVAGQTDVSNFLSHTGAIMPIHTADADAVARTLPKGGSKRVSRVRAPEIRTSVIGINALKVSELASFPLWNHLPRHFHQEMGRPYAINPPRPINLQEAVGGLVEDIFLIPGGFRCAR